MTAKRGWDTDPGPGGAGRRVPRVYAPGAPWASGPIPLSPDESHHLARVLRLGPGDAVEVFDGEGRSAFGALETADRRRATVALSGPPVVEAASAVGLTLIQSLPKGHKADFIVQKGVELGLARLVFSETERSVSRFDEDGAEARIERWLAVAVSAAKQCGRNRMPELRAASGLKDALAAMPADALLLACLPEAGADLLRDALRSLAGAGVANVVAFVGPEGGFSPAEAGFLRDAGARPVRLGRHILRTETAALFVMAALAYEFP